MTNSGCKPKSSRTYGCLAAFLVFVFAICAPSGAAQISTTWTGTTGNWSNMSNWDNGVPNGNFNAFIGNGSSPKPTANLDFNATVNNLTLDSGGVVITPGNSLTASGITMSGSVSFITGTTGAEMLNLGSITGNGTISNVGVSQAFLHATGGLLTIDTSSLGIGNSAIQVDTGSTLSISGGPFKGLDSSGTLSTGYLNLQGTLKIDNANITTISSAGISQFTLDGPGAQIVNQFNASALSNLSEIRNSQFTLTNGATLSTSGSLFNNGFGGDQFVVSNGSALTVHGDFQTCCRVGVSGSTMTVTGTWNATQAEPNIIDVGAGATVNVNGAFNNFGDNLVPDIVRVGDSTLTVEGDFNNGIGFSYSGGGGFVSLSQGSALNVRGTLNNEGSGFLSLSDGSTLSAQKDLNNRGSLSLATGSAGQVQGTLTNSGSVQIDNTSVLTVRSGFNQTAGSTVVDGLLNAPGKGVNIQGGILSGTGIVNGKVLMAGTMMPGDPTGIFTINGNYSQTSTGKLMEQVGWINGSNASLFQVNGVATLDGTLALTLLNGYDPTVGDSFILMTFLMGQGSFDTVTGLNLGNNLFFDLMYDPHDVRVVVESQPVATPEPNSSPLLLLGSFAILAIFRKRWTAKIASIPGLAS
jgi:hypothetical protein